MGKCGGRCGEEERGEIVSPSHKHILFYKYIKFIIIIL